MDRQSFAVVAVVAVVLLNPAISVKFDSSDEHVVVSAQRHKFNHGSHHTAREWIEAPNGFLYQFHVGDQSWLSAREFCLSQNSDLVVLRDKDQIDWLLNHYAPTYQRFTERYVQVGLMLPEGPNRDWTYVDGSKYDQSTIPWISGEPFDHSVDGKERCGLLRVHSRFLDDVDCESASRSHVRFICERNQEMHKTQQRSGNYLWKKVDELMKYFRIWTDASGNEAMKNSSKQDNDVEKISVGNNTSAEEEQAVVAVLGKLGNPGTTYRHRSSDEGDGSELLKTLPHGKQQINVNTLIGEEATTETTEPLITLKSNVAEVNVMNEKTAVAENTFTTEAEVTGEERSAKTVEEKPALTHAAPLREITAEEGSGVEVAHSKFEDSANLHHEIAPEKLEQVISTMEKMIERLENITLVEKKNGEKSESLPGEKRRPQTSGVKKDEEKQKEGQGEEAMSSYTVVKLSEKAKADSETLTEMEGDFDENLNKDLPTTDIRPQHDDDCEGEASGDSPIFAPISRNVVDAEDVDSLSQKPKIPAEREQHVQEFLQTLRTFLSRAEHNDLRKLLDDNPGKTLLEKMKLAISMANEREFNRLKELEFMKQNGIDISSVPDPDRMPDTMREELFRKIRGVVIAEAEKLDLESVAEPSARTTTEETLRQAAVAKHPKHTKGDQTTSSKNFIFKGGKSVKKAELRSDRGKVESYENERHVEEQEEQSQEVKERAVKHSAKQESKKEHKKTNGIILKKEASPDDTTEKQTKSKDDETTVSNVDAVAPERTMQLKEFEDKDEIMSKESQMPLDEESRETTESLKDLVKKKGKEGSVQVGTEPIKSEKRKNDESVEVSIEPMKLEKRKKDESVEVSTEPMKSEKRKKDESVEVSTESINDEKWKGTPKNDNNEKEAQIRKPTVDNSDNKTTTEDSVEQNGEEEEEEDKATTDASNPLGLPTLPPAPTLPPLPSLKVLFDNLTKHWQQLFKLPKPATTP